MSEGLPIHIIQRSPEGCQILHREGSAWQPCSQKSERLMLCLSKTLHITEALVIANTGAGQTQCEVHSV